MKTFQYEQKMYGSIFVKNLGSTNIKKKCFTATEMQFFKHIYEDGAARLTKSA